MHTQTDRFTRSCLLYLHVSSWRSLSSYVLLCLELSLEFTSQSGFLNTTNVSSTTAAFFSGDCCYKYSVCCSSSSASEVSAPVAVRNNIMASASCACSWWCHCACMQMEYCANGWMKNVTSASYSQWHPSPMHKVQGVSKNMCSHTSCIDCCCIVQCWSWSGQWWWW